MSLQLFDITLQPGALERLPLVGDVLQFYGADGDFNFGLEPNGLVPGRKDDIITVPFTQIYVSNTGGAAVTVNMRYGENVIFGRSDTITFSGAQPINIQNWPVDPIAGTFVPEVWNTILNPADKVLAAAAPTLISPARATKRLTTIKVSSGAGTSIRVGSVTVAASAGIEIEPGEAYDVSGDMAVYGYSVPGQTVSVTELDKV